jgi:arsenate reductase-like glutaredoxin family protein
VGAKSETFAQHTRQIYFSKELFVELDLSVEELQKLTKLFNLTADQILNYENIVPEDVTIMDKPDFEKLHLINQLDEDDKTTVFKIVDTMLTKKKFKDFFAKT